MSFSKLEKQFLNAASTSVIIPRNTKVPLPDILLEEEESSLLDVKQREILFFDEKLTTYVALHVLQCPEEELKSYLSRLELNLEVWATSDTQTAERNTGSSPTRDLIFSEKIDHNEDPIVLISQKESDNKIYLSLLWEVNVTLNRPHLRLYDIHVAFIPSAVFSPIQDATSNEAYLEPFKPQVGNLFAPLRNARGNRNEELYLPLSRLDSVLPLPPKDDKTFHLRSIPSRSIPTHLPCVTRLKYSRPNIENITSTIIASLDIELIPFVDIRGRIDDAQVHLQKGTLMFFMESMLPIECRSKDNVTFLYQLEQNRTVDASLIAGSAAGVDFLTINIKIQLQLSEDCHPLIEIKWTTNVDFASFNSISNMSKTSSQQQNSTPNMAVNGRPHNSSSSIGVSLQVVPQTGSSSIIAISFSASTESVRVGVPFVWQILVVNRTAKPAKLAIIPLPRVQKPTTQAQQYAKRHATRSSITSVHPSDRSADEKDRTELAQAVVDENIVYAMQHSGAVLPETDLMSLTPELRIGPLGPEQCHQGEIRLVAFRTGAFTLDAVRVVDLLKEIEQGYGGPGVVMDIKDLPDVIVEGTI